MTVMFINVQASYAADLMDTAARDGTFKKFVSAVRDAGLDDALKQAGPVTFFAPTDEAISKMSDEEWNALSEDRDKLSGVIKSHMIPGKLTIAEIKPGKVRTVQGNALNITSDNGLVAVGEANVIQSDLIADNGVIHAIDQIAQPAE